MHVHSLKHNAKAAAKRLAAKFSGIEVVEPVQHIPLPGPAETGWYASVRVMDGVLPSSIAAEVIAAAHIELPDGWMVYNGNSIQRVADVRGDDNEHRLDSAHYALEASLTASLLPLVGQPNNEATRDEAVTIIENVLLDQLLSGVKPGSKEAQVFDMLRQPTGVTVAEMAAAMNWQKHTTRAYISVRVRARGVGVVTVVEGERGRVYRLALPAPATVEA